MANKLLKPKRGRVENLPKLAVEDGSLIFAYDTKSPTSTVLVDVGETRYELSAATAKKADDSNALGGSSLQNIVDKIDNATGDGTAFTGLDTTTNNKVKLTRANGTTVEKTINNVSNASSASFASTATLAAYPQGFESHTTSATWGNTTGTFLTGWHTSSGGDVAFMNNNPSRGKVSMKLDGYFYQNEGANRVLDTSDAASYVKKAGDTMTGLLTLKIGSQ